MSTELTIKFCFDFAHIEKGNSDVSELCADACATSNRGLLG